MTKVNWVLRCIFFVVYCVLSFFVSCSSEGWMWYIILLLSNLRTLYRRKTYMNVYAYICDENMQVVDKALEILPILCIFLNILRNTWWIPLELRGQKEISILVHFNDYCAKRANEEQTRNWITEEAFLLN